MAGISESRFSKACKTVGEVARVAVKVLCVSALVAAVVASVFIGIASMFTGGLPLALTLIATIGTVVTTNVPAVVIGSAIAALGISYWMIPDRKGGDDDELPSPHSKVEPCSDEAYVGRRESVSSASSSAASGTIEIDDTDLKYLTKEDHAALDDLQEEEVH
jgi:hypothetical protein